MGFLFAFTNIMSVGRRIKSNFFENVGNILEVVDLKFHNSSKILIIKEKTRCKYLIYSGFSSP